MNIYFGNVWALYLVWIAPLIGIFWTLAFRRREGRISAFMSPEMQTKLRPRVSTHRFIAQTLLICMGIFLMMVALARPQWGTREYRVFSRGRDLVIALDVSRSMLADDTHPNRLQRAKADLMDLISELQGDRVALIAFRHKAILRCPLTTDYSFLQQALDGISINSAPRGETDIGDAIVKALDSFDNESGAHKAIVLISDGEDLTGRAEAAAETAGARNIPIFTVGLGSKKGGRIPMDPASAAGFIKYEGKEVYSKLNHETLYNLAKKSGGAYIHAATANMNLGTLYKDHLNAISSQDLEESQQVMRVERFQIFLLPAILCMLAGCFFSQGRLAAGQKATDAAQIAESKPRSNGFINTASVIILLVFTQSFTSTADTNIQQETTSEQSSTNSYALPPTPPGREGARIAQKLFRKGDYQKAAEAYVAAAKGSTASSQNDFIHNAAVCYYKAGMYKEAADIFKQQLLTQRDMKSNPASGLGASLYRAADLDNIAPTNIIESSELLKAAGEAFKEAARIEDSDASALDNLSVVLKKLPELEAQAEIAQIMKKYGGSQAGELSYTMLNNQRQIIEGMPDVLTNASPSQITQYEDFAQLQKENCKIWMPLKQKVMNQLAQQNTSTNIDISQIAQHMDAIQSTMALSSEELRNLDPSGFRSAAASQAGIYRVWKGLASYHQLISEDILQQSNTLSRTSIEASTEEPKLMQDEALGITKLFKERFSTAHPQEESSQPSGQEEDGEEKALSAEDRQKILDYTDMAITAQSLAAKHIEEKSIDLAIQEEQKALDLLKEIEKLLPKDDQQQQQQNNQKNQQQDSQQDQQPPPEQEPEEEQKDEDRKPEETTPEEILKMMNKALEREKEHEAEQEKRNSQSPMSPRERDW